MKTEWVTGYLYTIYHTTTLKYGDLVLKVWVDGIEPIYITGMEDSSLIGGPKILTEPEFLDLYSLTCLP